MSANRRRRGAAKPSNKRTKNDGNDDEDVSSVASKSASKSEKWKSFATGMGFSSQRSQQLITHYRSYDHGERGFLSSSDILERCLIDLPSVPSGSDAAVRQIVAQVVPDAAQKPTFVQYLECVAVLDAALHDANSEDQSNSNTRQKLNGKLTAYFRELTQNPFKTGKRDQANLGVAASVTTAAVSASSAESREHRAPLTLSERFGAYLARLTENPAKPADQKRTNQTTDENTIEM